MGGLSFEAHKANTTATHAIIDTKLTATVAPPGHEHDDESTGGKQGGWTLPQAEPGPFGPGFDALMEHMLASPSMQ